MKFGSSQGFLSQYYLLLLLKGKEISQIVIVQKHFQILDISLFLLLRDASCLK